MKHKNIAINVSNLSKGGGAQIAIWLINKMCQDTNLSFNLTYIVSPFVWNGIKHNFINSNNVHVIQRSPVRSFMSKSMIKEIILNKNIELVYTLYGPSGVKFSCKEISGVANAWISCAKLKNFWQVYGLFLPVEMVKFFIHGRKLSKKDFLTFETELSRDNYCKRFRFKKSKTTIIPNSVNDYFYLNNEKKGVKKDVFNILYVSTYYKHKNIELIPIYAMHLKKSGVISSFKFQLTLSNADFERILKLSVKLGVSDLIENLGVISSGELPQIYQDAGLIISPSSLETFSAVYAEAILSNKYLIVADRGFSRAICKDAALYFEPSDVNTFVELTEGVFLEKYTDILYTASIRKKELFISSEERYKLIKNLLLNFINDDIK